MNALLLPRFLLPCFTHTYTRLAPNAIVGDAQYSIWTGAHISPLLVVVAVACFFFYFTLVFFSLIMLAAGA